MAIDFGSKRVGVALSDESLQFAIPYGVISVDKNLLEETLDIIKKNGVTNIIIGDSRDYKGKDNPIMKKARAFGEKIKSGGNMAIHWEPEFLTSVAAARLQGENRMLDASAAALILQSFLDKQARVK